MLHTIAFLLSIHATPVTTNAHPTVTNACQGMPCSTRTISPVSRTSADHYAMIGHAVVTNACTVTTASANLNARLDMGQRDGKPWLYFYDVSGHREADCEVLAIVTVTEVE